MCGRYSQTKIEEKELTERFKLKKLPSKREAQYNIAPQQNVQAVLNATPDELSLVRWGLVPIWAKEINTRFSMINARAESLTEKPAYRGLIKRKRCLVIADSFYEWKKMDGKKQPFRIMLKDEGLFAFAGLWDHWERDGHEITSCTIITTMPNDLMKDIHERMPVILHRQDEALWLSDCRLEEALGMLRPYPSPKLKAYPISLLVNAPAHNVPQVTEPLEGKQELF